MLCLGLNVVQLVSVLVVGPLLHVSDPTYPVPDAALVADVWLLAIVPGSIVLASFSFALGTLLPRLPILVRVVPIVGWVGLVFLSNVVDHGGTWFTTINPTSYGIVRTEVEGFLVSYQTSVIGVADATRRFDEALRLQQTPPDLSPFVVPHLGLIFASLLLIAWTANRFRRFRAELGGA